MFSSSLKRFLREDKCLRWRLVFSCSSKSSDVQLLTKCSYVFNKLNVLYVIKCRCVLSVFCVLVIKAL